MTNCANCNSPLQPQSKFCAQCGQSIVSFKKPIKPVLTDMVHEALDIDGRMLLTFKTLLFKPGLLSLEYNNGKRMKYTPPLRLYLVISVLFFLLLSLLANSPLDPNGNYSSYSDYYPKMMFVLLPVFALILQLLFKEAFYLSNLIFAIHIHCISYLAFSVMFPLEAYEKHYPIFIFLQFPLFFYLMVYLVLALKRHYAQSWPKTLAKFILLLLVYVGLMGIAIEYILGIAIE